jgi:nitrogen-specific signal transduction histidine kinase
MMKNSYLIFLSLCCTILIAFSCSSPKSTILQPDKQPYKFKNVRNFGGDGIVLTDLDGNGFTEIITINVASAAVQHSGSYIMLMTFEGKIVEQINYPGKIIDSIYLVDYNDDGIKEILVPFVRNDSLFVSFVNTRGEKQFYFFLIDGKPRIEDGGTMDWDPQVRGFYFHDLDKDGNKELITVITTGYARLPRGVLVHSVPQGKLLGKLIIGSPPRDNFLDDFDGDGQLELLCTSTAPDNGANAGGFNDQYSYLIMFELNPQPQVANWIKMCKKYSAYVLFYEDLDGDTKKELLAWTESYSARVIESKIVELDPATFKEIRKRSFNTSLTSVVITNLNRDSQQEIVFIRSQKEILILNNNFDEQKYRSFPLNLNSVKVLSDLDHDGIDDVVVSAREGEFLLDANLKIKACFPGMQCMGVIRRGENLPPQLVVKEKDHFAVGFLVKNQWYLVNRYYKPVLYLLVALLFVVLTKLVINLSRDRYLLNNIQLLTIDSDARGFLLFNRSQKIYLMNLTLSQWLGIRQSGKKRKLRLADLFSSYPEILAFLSEKISQPARQYEKRITLNLKHNKRKLLVIIEPLPGKRRKKQFWFVTFFDKSIDDELLQAKTWCRMAQKTAHDIKSPLSAIMLTLQRLQIRLKERFPPVGEEFDNQFARIIERIESLRRISKNFMKFVNIETLNFVTTDINEFLNETVNTIRPGLPPDIQLNLQSGSDMSAVKIDPDAMRSVIENLVSNAVNAMPDGGKITLSSQFLQGLTFPGNEQTVKDYVLIEVSDTGIGIAAADRERLFEPDFTKTEGGNGMGLAFVKKTVDDHGGYIEVESEPGAGTAFCIYIPIM